MTTYALWRVFDVEAFGGLYDAQARSLLAGRWDVPQESLRGEGFVRDGKYYTYFGFVPAVLRTPLAFLAPDMDGRWCRLSVILAVTVGAIFSYRLLLRAGASFGFPNGLPGKEAGVRALTPTQRSVYPLFVIATGLGSSTIYIASRTFVHHESPAWGAALAIGSFYYLVAFTQRPGALGQLVAAGALAFAAFFSRATHGVGPLFALSLLTANLIAWQLHRRRPTGLLAALLAPARALCGWSPTPPSFRATVVAAAAVLITVSTYVTLNYVKFRTFFDGAPSYLEEQTAREPGRMQRIGGGLMSAGNVTTNAYNYFTPNRVEFTRNFPWIDMTRQIRVFPTARLDKVEPYASLPVSAPLFLALTVIGLCCIRRPLVLSRADVAPDPEMNPSGTAAIPMAGALVGVAALLPVNFVTERYLHDFFPLLVLASAFGLHAVLAISRNAFRRITLAALAVAFVASVYVNMAFAMQYQRTVVWGVPRERKVAYWHVRCNVDRYISRLIWPDLPLLDPP